MKKPSILHIPVRLEKEHINRLLASRLSEIQLRDNLKITNVKIDGDGKLFTLDLRVSGVYNGTLRVHFTPQFDNVHHRLLLDQLRIEMLDSGLLSKGLNWMMQGVMQNKIEETIQSQLDKKLKEIVEGYLNQTRKITLPDGLIMELLVTEIDIYDLHFQKSILTINTELKGHMVLASDTDKMT